MSNEFRKFTKLLNNNGYERVRVTGSHYIFKNGNGNTVSVPKDLNRMIARRLRISNHLV